MSRHILIVDTVSTNRIALSAKLKKAHYKVHCTHNISQFAQSNLTNFWDAVILCTDDAHDLIDLPQITHLERTPLLVMSDNTSALFRVSLLQSGADDIVPKSTHTDFLLARLRGLIRMRHANFELRVREDTNRALGFHEKTSHFQPVTSLGLIVNDSGNISGFKTTLRSLPDIHCTLLSEKDVFDLSDQLNALDCFVIMGDTAHKETHNNLLLDLRANSDFRHAAIFYATGAEEAGTAALALNFGANDVLFDHFTKPEILERINRQVLLKKTNERLRKTIMTGLDAAVKDSLTGLHNRRFAITHLKHQFEEALKSGNELSIIMIDLDHFKSINDTFGHAAGDEILKKVAGLLKTGIRASDLVARVGGEEFVIILPDTAQSTAIKMARRLCFAIRNEPPHAIPRKITASFGVSSLQNKANPLLRLSECESLLNQADIALYAAKENGRNRVSEYCETAA